MYRYVMVIILQVIQRRINASLDFDRSWTEYRYGFGDVDGNFWLG